MGDDKLVPGFMSMLQISDMWREKLKAKAFLHNCSCKQDLKEQIYFRFYILKLYLVSSEFCSNTTASRFYSSVRNRQRR